MENRSVISFLLFLSLVSPGTLPGSSEYLAAHRAEQSGKYIDAAAGFGACAAKPGPLQGYAWARYSACLAKAGQAKAAAEEYRRLIKQMPQGPWVAMAYAGLAEFRKDQGDYAGAARAYEKVLESPFKPSWLEQYQWLAADNYLRIPEESHRAYSFYRLVLADPRRRLRRFDAAERLSNSLLPEDRWVAAENLVKFGSYKVAMPVLAGLAFETSDPERVPEWKYLQGRVLVGLGKADEGLKLLQEVARDYAGTPWGLLAKAHAIRGVVAAKPEQGKAELDAFVMAHPDSEEAGDLLWWYAGHLAGKGKTSEAAEAYGRVATLCPVHERADDALFEQGKRLKELKRPKEAAGAFETLTVKYPSSPFNAEAGYLCGQLRESIKDKAGAAAAYERAVEGGLGNFYAHRALDRLHALGKAPETDVFRVSGAGFRLGLYDAPERPPAHVGPSLDAEERARLAFFGANGLPEGEWEALYLANRGDGRPEALAFYGLIADFGLAHTAAQMADAASCGFQDGRPLPSRYYLIYPRPYWDEVCSVARETGLDPYLLLSIARQESTFRPAVASRAGATGVMQLMPATARWLAETEPAIGPEHAADLTFPANSLRLGAYYLMRMVQQHDGNLVYALAAYNGGPGNVRKWRRQMPGLDTVSFMERIPYEETREYVKRVLGNYGAYRSLYRGALDAAVTVSATAANE
jgi:soluble lytic murein transglycosylase